MRGRIGRLLLVPAAMAVLGGCALLMPVSNRPAEHGWTAIPTEPDPAFVEAAQLQCLDGPGMAGYVEDREPLFDQRGPLGAGVLWSDPDGRVYCFLQRSGDRAEPSFSQFSIHDGIREPYQEWASSPGDIMWIVGPAHPTAAEVRVLTTAGRDIVATLGDGMYTAWWPDDGPAVSVTFLDRRATSSRRWRSKRRWTPRSNAPARRGAGDAPRPVGARSARWRSPVPAP